jgi:hypothetical protein
MKVLLIWDSCGQNSPALYFVTGDSAKIALAAHGQYINSDDDETENTDKIKELLDSQSTSKDFAMVNTTKPDNYDAISICGWLP